MVYAATAVARARDSWRAHDVDLSEVGDLDALADLLRDLGEDGPVVLFLEENDEYLLVVRLDETGEPAYFLSDRRAAAPGTLASQIFAGEVPEDPIAAEVDEDGGVVLGPQPAGDPGLLADFGVSGTRLLALCAQEGLLPGDVISEICEGAGCLEELEALRGT